LSLKKKNMHLIFSLYYSFHAQMYIISIIWLIHDLNIFSTHRKIYLNFFCAMFSDFYITKIKTPKAKNHYNLKILFANIS
ncbi:hypothetical protein LLE87_37695, partial [Paenibacillus polymyxa]|nr:hypothetical protein [Paenibacillus polymyxa]